MNDEEGNIAPLLSHPNPNSNDNNKSHGEKGMYMDWLGRPADDRADLGGWNRALWNAGKKRKEKKRKNSMNLRKVSSDTPLVEIRWIRWVPLVFQFLSPLKSMWHAMRFGL